MRRALAVLVVLPALLAPSADAASVTATKRSLARNMADAGTRSSAYVVDLGTGKALYGRRATTKRIPASNEKLFTTATALLTLGPDARPDTTALARTKVDLDGTVDGDLYLQGTGDPTLTGTDIRNLATSIARAGVTRIDGHVVGDDTWFDGVRGTNATGLGPNVDLSPLGALMVDRGRTGSARPYYQQDPPKFAASALAAALRARGVDVPKAGRAGAAPKGALIVATAQAPTFAQLARLANVPSDNTIAETLLKAVAAKDEAPGTTADGADVVEATLSDEFGISPAVADGSGLSRYDRTSPRDLVGLLSGMRDTDAWQPFYDSLAVMGRTGTLAGRLRSSAARDRCRGKTGTLHDVSALSGYCTTRSGRTVAFSFLMNRVNPSGARVLQDRMVDALARL